MYRASTFQALFSYLHIIKKENFISNEAQRENISTRILSYALNHTRSSLSVFTNKYQAAIKVGIIQVGDSIVSIRFMREGHQTATLGPAVWPRHDICVQHLH